MHTASDGIMNHKLVSPRTKPSECDEKCTKVGRGNNSTGHETLERRLVQLVIVRGIQPVLHSTSFTKRRTKTLRCFMHLHVGCQAWETRFEL
jgi:hypothetical protein